MKKSITVEFNSGESAIFVAYPPDFAKWEMATKKSISEFAGMWDILFVAHSAYKREAGGKPTKSLDIWMESITNLEVGDDLPKVIAEEVSADS
jgi:hypothetical protein